MNDSAPAPDILFSKIVDLLKDFTQDWDCEYESEMAPQTLLLADLGFESIDIIQLTVALEEMIGKRKLPWERLLMSGGRYVDDLSIGQVTDFLRTQI